MLTSARSLAGRDNKASSRHMSARMLSLRTETSIILPSDVALLNLVIVCLEVAAQGTPCHRSVTIARA